MTELPVFGRLDILLSSFSCKPPLPCRQLQIHRVPNSQYLGRLVQSFTIITDLTQPMQALLVRSDKVPLNLCLGSVNIVPTARAPLAYQN